MVESTDQIQVLSDARIQLLEDLIAPLIRGKRSNKLFKCDLPFDEQSGYLSQEELRIRTIQVSSKTFLNDCRKPLYTEPFFRIVPSQDTVYGHTSDYPSSYDQVNQHGSKLLIPFNQTSPRSIVPPLFPKLFGKSKRKNKVKSKPEMERNHKFIHQGMSLLEIDAKKEQEEMEDEESQQLKCPSKASRTSKIRNRFSKNSFKQGRCIEETSEISSNLEPSSPFTSHLENFMIPLSSLSNERRNSLENGKGQESITLYDKDEISSLQKKDEIPRIRLQLMIEKERIMMEKAKARMIQRMSLFENGDNETLNPVEIRLGEEEQVQDLANAFASSITTEKVSDSSDDEIDRIFLHEPKLCQIGDSGVREFSILGTAILSSCKLKNVIPQNP